MHMYTIRINEPALLCPTRTRHFLDTFKGTPCLDYLDDLIIFFNTVDDHICHVDEILTS